MSSTETVIEHRIILKELRIGNLVFDNITKKSKRVEASFFSSAHDDDRFCFLNITKDRLKDMRFYECMDGVFVHHKSNLHFRVCQSKKDEWTLLVGPVEREYINRKIKYLHTIQNIFQDIYETETEE